MTNPVSDRWPNPSRMDRRSINADVKKAVPGLHPGLNDLIRVLGKQAHCASRTLIVCEPVCPKTSYSESKYHKNCGSPKKGRSWDSLCRPSSLWSPVRPESYYYDCFFYRQYPDRDSEYQEIEEKYNAIKQQKLDYSPPECDEDRIKAIVGSLNKAGGTMYAGLDDYSRSSAGKGGRGGKGSRVLDDWSGPGAFKNRDNLKDSSMGSARNHKHPLGSSGSKKNMVSEGDSVPCAELAEIRDLLKKSDRETIRRMQEMLTLMKELSVKDICRATCDGSLPRRRFKTGETKSAENEEDLYAVSQESNMRLEQGGETRKRKGGDVPDYSPQDKKKRYQQRGDRMRRSGESDDYGPQGLNKSYQQRDDHYGPDGSVKSYKQRDDDYGPQGPGKLYQQKDDYDPQGSLKSYKQRDEDYGPLGSKKSYQGRDDYDPQGSLKSYQLGDDGYEPKESKKSYQRGSDSSKRKRGGDDVDDGDDYNDVELQEFETYQKAKPSKKNKRGADDVRSSQRWDPTRKGKKNTADGEIPAELNEDEGGYAGSQADLDIEEPRSLQRHLVSPNRARGRLGDDDESLASTSDSEASRSSTKRKRPSSRRGKGKTAVSESDTDQSESSSIYSESSSTDVSLQGKDGESEFESSDTEHSEAPEGTSSSGGMLKRHQDGSISSSQASLSVQGSATSLDKTRNEDRSRPGLYQEQQFPKQSGLPGSSNEGAPGQPGSGTNYKIPVGKKNVPLTVHEVVELSNKITDVIVLEIIDELIRHRLYFPPSRRYLQEPGATMPSTSIEGVMKPTSSSKKLNEQGPFDGTRDSSGYKEISREVQMKQTGSPTRLSRIDESSSRAGSKGASRKDVSTRDIKQGEKRQSDESTRSSCPRHSKSLSPSTSSRRRSSSCRLEIERRARSEGDRYKDPTQTPGDVIPPKVPPKPWERRLSSQMKADSMRDSSKTDDQGRSDRPGTRGASMSSQVSKASSYKPPSARVDQASLRDSAMDGIPGRPPTLPGSRPNLTDGSQRSTRQYETQPQDKSDMPGSRRASLRSQMSKTGSYRAPSTRSDQPSLKDGSLPGRQPTLPGSRQNIASGSPRSTTQYQAAGPDKSSLPGSHRASLSSQMSKQSDRNRPPYGPGKTAGRQRDIHVDSSVNRTQVEDPRGPGKVPSGPRISKESSKPHGILKDSSPTSSLRGNQIEDVHGPGNAPIVCQVPKERSREDVFGTGHVPSGQQIPTEKYQPDKTLSSQRIMGKNASNRPVLTGEEEVSKGRLDKIIRPDNADDYVQDGAGAMPRTSLRSPIDSEPCEPDDFIATNYDTDKSVLYYARITSSAFPPVKETYHAAGFILRSAYNYDIPARSKVSVKTDLLLQLPRNSYGRIAPRKCLVENYGIDVVADVIDRDYKGNITVVLFNHSDSTFTIERGNKIAQLICESIHLAKVVENNNLLK